MNGWNDFYMATAGSAAALTGLIFVGVSISHTKILATPALPGRALISLILLFTILIISLLFLVPVTAASTHGIQVLVTGITAWLTVSKIDSLISRNKQNKYRKQYRLNMFLNQLALLPYIIGGFMILLGIDPGIYWVVASVILSFIKAGLDAWVLLIEINR